MVTADELIEAITRIVNTQKQPIPISLDEDLQVQKIFQYGRIVEVNEALIRLQGLEKVEDIVGQKLTDLLVPTEDAKKVQEPRKRPLLHSQSGHASFPSARTPSSVPP